MHDVIVAVFGVDVMMVVSESAVATLALDFLLFKASDFFSGVELIAVMGEKFILLLELELSVVPAWIG